MHIQEFAASVQEFATQSDAEKIRLLAWFIHTHKKLKEFRSVDIKNCFDELDIALPSSISAHLNAMAKRKPSELLVGASGFRLEARVRERFDLAYGQRASAITIHNLLSNLPTLVPNIVERAYLDEALICFRHQAFRASIVMTWNLAYDHLCYFVLDKHLNAFNMQLPKSYPKADIKTITKREDFSELKESQVLQICSSSTIISGSLHKVLKEKLDRRNVSAHPSGITISQLTAEEFIKDLIENVVLKLV